MTSHTHARRSAKDWQLPVSDVREHRVFFDRFAIWLTGAALALGTISFSFAQLISDRLRADAQRSSELRHPENHGPSRAWNWWDDAKRRRPGSSVVEIEIQPPDSKLEKTRAAAPRPLSLGQASRVEPLSSSGIQDDRQRPRGNVPVPETHPFQQRKSIADLYDRLRKAGEGRKAARVHSTGRRPGIVRNSNKRSTLGKPGKVLHVDETGGMGKRKVVRTIQQRENGVPGK